MKAKKEQKEIAFEFQEIDLAEAQDAVLAGDGNYGSLKAGIIESIRKLEPGKALTFGLPKGEEVAEEARRGICMAVNASLKRGQIDWRVTYSSTKKLFIVVPRNASRAITKKPVKASLDSTRVGLDVEEFLTRCKNLLNYDFNVRNQKMRAARKAISVVGIKDLGFRPRDLAPFLGISESGVAFNSTAPGDSGKEEVAKLRASLKS